MKTPKRTCRDCLFFTSYSSADPDGRCGEGCGTYGTHTKGSEAACNAFMLSSAAKSARRKRKNRIAQLKRSLHKYKEGTMLPKLMHIRYAYKWIQKLKKPNQNAEVICWHTYLSELKVIQDSINRAVEDAAISLGEAIANRERKEQE